MHGVGSQPDSHRLRLVDAPVCRQRLNADHVSRSGVRFVRGDGQEPKALNEADRGA